MESYPRESKEYLPVPIDGPGTLTSHVVDMQVCLYPVRPADDGWKTAGWDTVDGQTVAQIMIGPGSDFDFSDEPGTYVPYVRIHATPELPVVEGAPVQIS
ncbi:hypothetical protein [Nonomuraea rubra]|uniref:Uncharacterized protein n=1 Tax=Nonomuraea rubra TaxID=46180 RepID=A0A7X0P6H3_9ACTN|nr:hypothetical protein [Nonomuraea rubra]MBB6556165.1 hypothetical protein [Nonomuraea rubra]